MPLSYELEGTQRVRTELLLILTLMLTFDHSTQNHVTCRIFQCHFEYQFWTLWDHSFLSYVPNISVKMHLLTLWPWPLTFEPQNNITSRVSHGHSLYQIWTLWNHSFLLYRLVNLTTKESANLPHPLLDARRFLFELGALAFQSVRLQLNSFHVLFDRIFHRFHLLQSDLYAPCRYTTSLHHIKSKISLEMLL